MTGDIKDVKPYFKGRNYRLYEGDCVDLIKAIPDETFDMIFADPPYFLSGGSFTC